MRRMDLFLNHDEWLNQNSSNEIEENLLNEGVLINITLIQT